MSIVDRWRPTCPECGSEAVELTPASETPDQYQCAACNHEWHVPPVMLKRKPDRRKQPRREERDRDEHPE
jgi:hypothetical protein